MSKDTTPEPPPKGVSSTLPTPTTTTKVPATAVLSDVSRAVRSESELFALLDQQIVCWRKQREYCQEGDRLANEEIVHLKQQKAEYKKKVETAERKRKATKQLELSTRINEDRMEALLPVNNLKAPRSSETGEEFDNSDFVTQLLTSLHGQKADHGVAAPHSTTKVQIHTPTGNGQVVHNLNGHQQAQIETTCFLLTLLGWGLKIPREVVVAEAAKSSHHK